VRMHTHTLSVVSSESIPVAPSPLYHFDDSMSNEWTENPMTESTTSLPPCSTIKQKTDVRQSWRWRLTVTLRLCCFVLVVTAITSY
jgi:hypothetical protein